ncbi:MAG: LytTR family DNA-binding domain-containing protein [Anaerovoracaceae bacterium]
MSKTYRDNFLVQIEGILRDSRFVRVHSGYVVNMDFIDEIKKNHIVMKNGETLPVSRNIQQEFMEQYMDYILEGRE